MHSSDRRGYKDNIFSPGKHMMWVCLRKCLNEVLLMSNKTCFHGEIRKILIFNS